MNTERTLLTLNCMQVRLTVHATYAASVVTVAGGVSGLLAWQPAAAANLGFGPLCGGWGTLTAITAVAGIPGEPGHQEHLLVPYHSRNHASPLHDWCCDAG